jgi:hypothetical protein
MIQISGMIRFVRASISIALIVSAVMILSCSTAIRNPREESICREHGIHSYKNRDEFAACFGLSPEEIDSFYIFSREEKFPEAQTNAGIARLKNAVADEIVEVIMKRLEAAFGSDLNTNWRLESIDMPVPFRTFLRTGSSSVTVTVAALVRKKDLEPSSLIHFLPLEYKMKLIKPNEKEIREFGNP